ncbi:MAG: hypothetical protein WBX25_12745 [Rhodomicrobium sp.]
MPADPIIYTSLPPVITRMAAGAEIGSSYRRACISSWRALGTKIISLNSSDEIRCLAGQHDGIEFYETEKAPPRIVDFIEAAKASGANIAAIINADCLLIANRGIIDAAIEAAASGMVLFERLNVNPEDLCPTGMDCYGFDFFLFDTKILDQVSFDDQLQIGSPWWDLWFPLAYRCGNGEVFCLEGPALLHLDHSRGFSQESWIANGTRCHQFLSRLDDMWKFTANRDTSYEKELASLGRKCFYFLRSNKLRLKSEDEMSQMYCLLLKSIVEKGNTRVHRRAQTAEARPLNNLRKYFKRRLSALVREL